MARWRSLALVLLLSGLAEASLGQSSLAQGSSGTVLEQIPEAIEQLPEAVEQLPETITEQIVAPSSTNDGASIDGASTNEASTNEIDDTVDATELQPPGPPPVIVIPKPQAPSDAVEATAPNPNEAAETEANPLEAETEAAPEEATAPATTEAEEEAATAESDAATEAPSTDLEAETTEAAEEPSVTEEETAEVEAAPSNGEGNPAAENIETAKRVYLGENQISFVPPTGFTAMSQAEIKAKFPQAMPPKYVYANEARDISVGITISEIPLQAEQLPEVKAVLEDFLETSVPGFQWLEHDFVNLSGQDWIKLEFISQTENQRIHNDMYITSLQGKLLGFNFNANLAVDFALRDQLQDSRNSILLD